jgi:hypothetical protein
LATLKRIEVLLTPKETTTERTPADLKSLGKALPFSKARGK